MLIVESIKMAWQNIITNKMRSFLTTLGIVIGVASVIALISVVSSVKNYVIGEVMSMGADNITIQVIGTPLKIGLTQNDLDNLSEVQNIKGISPTISGSMTVAAEGDIMENVEIKGKNETYFQETDDLIETGRPITKYDIESKNRVCIIGNDVANTLFPGQDPIGQELIINGYRYSIIGTLQKTAGFTTTSNNNSVIVPYSTAMALAETGYINQVDLYMEDESLSEETTDDIERVLNTAFNYKDNAFYIINMQDVLDMVDTMSNTMTTMLVGIASIALLVGGIGIMNMMLVSVTERTTEIGLRKALGAEPRTIQLQFLIESFFLSIFGGILGMILGFGASFWLSDILDVTYAIAPYSVILALGFSGTIGIIFGYAPARKASQLNPIDALRTT